MYQALYRKYRPKSFEDVIDQNVVVKILKNSVKLNKINHAYLFSGPKGSGKTTIAKIFAKMINCKDLKDGSICNKCVFCTQKDSEMMDVIEIDAASNNGVDEIREINNKVNLVPTLGKYKVYIIDEVHMLTIGAFNALLKTLEEPPAHVIFILATTDPQKLPMTILSRCQRFDFKKISESGICEKIKQIATIEDIKIEEQAILEISKVSDGSLRDALGILDQAINYAEDEITIADIFELNGTVRQEELLEFINVLFKKDVLVLFNKIEKFNNDGKNLSKIIESLIFLIKDIIIYKIGKKDVNQYTELSKDITVQILTEYLIVLNETLNSMKKGLNYMLIFEITILKLCNTEAIDSNFEKNDDKKSEKEETVNDKETKDKENDNKKISREIKSDAEHKMLEFKRNRMNNILATFSKAKTIELRNEMKKLNDYLLDEKIGLYVEMILDGSISAASEEGIIFVLKTKNVSDMFNKHILELEKVIETVLKFKYKIISTYTSDWEVIKKDFNSQKQKYIYIKETISIEEILNNEETNNNFTNLFAELVEYK